MKIYTELSEFEPWGGAVDTWRIINEEGLLDQFEMFLDETFPDEPHEMSKTELNDLLWFDGDTVFEWLGLRTESQIQEEIYEVEEELEELCEELEELCAEDEDYKESYDDLQERIKDAKDRIDELNEEKAEL